MKTCSLIKDTEKQLIKDILINKDINTANNTINYIIKNLKGNGVSKEVFIFRERLNQPLENYSKNSPHISAAKKMVNLGIQIQTGDIISYFITNGSGPVSNRAEPAYHTSQVEIDVNYYINKHLLPMKENLFKATGLTKGTHDWYHYYLKTLHWLFLREEALKYAEYKCQVCSSHEDLEAHHNTYERLWNERISDLIILCSQHHELFHIKGGIRWEGEKSSPLSA